MAGGKPSMLDVAMKKMKMENRSQVIHCLTLISRLSPAITDKRDVGAHYETLFKQCHQQYQGEGPTGMLLVYPQHVVHMIEGSWELLTAVIRDASEMNASSGLLVNSHLLNFSTHVHPRLYPQWAYRVLNLPTLSKGEAYQPTETIAETVGFAVSVLYKLGVHLSKHHLQVKATLDNLPESFLLRQDLLEYLVSCAELDSPDEFIHRYCQPTQVILDSELVWPVPNRLFPYD